MFLEKTGFFPQNLVFRGEPRFLLAKPAYFKGLEAQGIYHIYIYIYSTFLLIHNHTFSHPGSAIAQDALRRRMEAAWRGTVE